MNSLLLTGSHRAADHQKKIQGGNERNMKLYPAEVRHRAIRRVAQRHDSADNTLIKAPSAKQGWTKARGVAKPAGSAVCSSCRHGHCAACEDCSAAKEYSDYWICHCCAALTHRVPSLH